MNMQQINEHNYVFLSSVNIGYVHEGNQGMIIDAAIDKSSIRKVVRQIEAQNLPITHLLITHAHSDHYGGAKYLQDVYNVKVIAPKFEATILQHPILEPTYLFMGNDPLDELRNKFLEGPSIEADIVIDEGDHQIDEFQFEAIATPGHSYNQLAIRIHDTLFAADSYFGEKELHKHKIPYITSVYKTMDSLEKLKSFSANGAVPGHGNYEENFIKTIERNIEYHQDLLHRLYCIIQDKQPISHEELVSIFCDEMSVNASQLSMFLLFRTAATAYITALIQQEKIDHYIQRHRWMFQIKEEEGT
ncbi:MBL fold metallo-hydrolase [Aquisalibacillus elongatus]|uniref:Glyoxylase-like metal-dependent hydrolase (Beta-lactamase superfamily II) n=1 Tax=Aquisalibacillus elongatus TaxID=485577 RepID=A0A3N5B4U1_9BACI|nr:MBL fold metallo-hydrolase [Aquisalibacillus elongatus]RPF52129.1 glyoxylase-like metal-dependent hydrolase (beta-lactamase superfamily II) [Aquisalibacillus elongatus]